MVRVKLTRRGDQLVTDLTETHLAELRKLAAALSELAPAASNAAHKEIASVMAP